MPDRRESVDLAKWVVPLLPVLFAAMGWLISSINEHDRRILSLQAQMMLLVDPQGQIIPSPGNAIARQELKEEMMLIINELRVRTSLVEQNQNRGD